MNGLNGSTKTQLEAVRASIVQDLNSRAVPAGYAKLQAYLGSPYPVLGLSTSQIREVMKNHKPALKPLKANELNALAELIWRGPTHEEKSFAISLFNNFSKLLNDRSWSITNRWIEQASGWALCDSLGSGPISSMLYQEPDHFDEVLDWTGSKNMWRRRISTYAMSSFVFAGELEKPFLLIDRLLYDKEFWVQRAVGTWLRECWKKDRKRTETYLRNHVKGLPRVVITVATERAPKTFREELRQRRTE